MAFDLSGVVRYNCTEVVVMTIAQRWRRFLNSISTNFYGVSHVVVEVEGRPDRVLTCGDTLEIPADAGKVIVRVKP